MEQAVRPAQRACAWRICRSCWAARWARSLIRMFLTPYDIAPGGVTGIATILHYLFSLPVGLTALVMNVPLF